jgi:hypothetical protein
MYTDGMTKHHKHKIIRPPLLSSAVLQKMMGETTTSHKLGGVTVLRSTRTGKDGPLVKVEVFSSHRKQLARETEKQIRDLIASPITPDQRLKANQLAKKAKVAQESSVTARFRRVVA